MVVWAIEGTYVTPLKPSVVFCVSVRSDIFRDACTNSRENKNVTHDNCHFLPFNDFAKVCIAFLILLGMKLFCVHINIRHADYSPHVGFHYPNKRSTSICTPSSFFISFATPNWNPTSKR